MSNGGAQSASGIATYRTLRELGSRSPRSYAAVREPNELVVIHRFSRSTDPRAKSTASFVSPDGGVSLASDAMATLVRDARCLAKNWHPNIARVRHVDIEGEDLTIATEVVDGVTLADLLAAAAAQRAASAGSTGAAKVAPGEPLLPLPVLVRILVDVVTGLSGLHGLRDDHGAPLGALHGALSPANIVVGKDGVGRLLNALRPRPLRVAAGTEAVGYAAPEALDLGATQDVRVDLHSVGVIMWEGLTGRRLYEETDPARVLARQREDDVAPPSFPAGSPFARLADVTMRALAFDPSLRFKTAAEMAAALRNIAATRIATGIVVATQVAELAGERIRARRIELDPSSTGKRRLMSERSLRAANAASPAMQPRAAASASAASPDHDTLPPGAMDPTDVGPPSSIPHDLSVRDFLEPAVSAPAPPRAPAPPTALAPPPAPAPTTALAPAPAPAAAPPKKTLTGHAAPGPKQTLVGHAFPAPASAPALTAAKPAAKPAPPLVRKTANAASSASTKAATSSPAVALPVAAPPPPPVAATLEGAAAPAPASLPPPSLTAPLHVASPNQDVPASAPPPAWTAPSPPAALPTPTVLPTLVFDDFAAPPPPPPPPPPNAYAPVVRSTPDGAFTPTSVTPPRDRRSTLVVLLGLAAALLLVVGFFAVRAMVTGPDLEKTAGAVGSATATATATGPATAGPNDEAMPATPAAATATATASPEPTTEAPSMPTVATAATAEASTATAATAATAADPAVSPPPPAAGAPAAPRPQTPTAPRPKRPTYEPLGI